MAFCEKVTVCTMSRIYSRLAIFLRKLLAQDFTIPISQELTTTQSADVKLKQVNK